MAEQVVTKAQVEQDSGYDRRVFEQFVQVRDGGEANMLDFSAVMYAAGDIENWDLLEAMDQIGRRGWGRFVMVTVSAWLAAEGQGATDERS